MGIEIEKKFLVGELPFDIESFSYHKIEQAYLNVDPAVRVRKEDDSYYMTYKASKADYDGIGKMEYNMPLDEKSYTHLLKKADGNVITKRRYLIPINDDAYDEKYLKEHLELSEMLDKGEIKIELDVFEGVFTGRILAEVEFPDEDSAYNYHMASWFTKEVTGDAKYSNSQMSREKF